MPRTSSQEGWHTSELISAVKTVCLKNSEYEFVRGGHGGDYIDVDEFYGDNRNLGAEKALDALVAKIVTVHETSPLRAVVFVERDSGPVGMIAARHKFAEQVHLPLWTLRPRKRIRKAAIKGGQLKPGDCVAIVTDVSTSGETIGEAARTIVELGGRVAAAISFVDRENGAREALGQMDIHLESVYTLSELQNVEQASSQGKG